jgi:ABC-type Fe3+ transport system substrate-binding protein
VTRADFKGTAIRTLGLWMALAGFAAPALAAEQQLIDAARKEGRVTWYTALIVDQFAQPAADAFKKKYGIEVDLVRADPNAIAVRILNEARAGQVQADIFDGAGLPALVRAGYVARWTPDSAKRLPREFVDANGYWAASNLYIMAPGINTNLVPKGTEPRTYEDLLNPKWTDKMAWTSRPGPTSARGFIGTILAEFGEEKGMDYLQRLSRQKVANVDASARQVLDLVIAGEYPIALQIFNNHAVISAQKGAPSAWIAMEPTLALLGVFQLTTNSPHPNAGKLLFDFIESEEGQQIFRDADYMPVDPKVPPREASLRPDSGKFRAKFFTPEQIDVEQARWSEIYDKLFR